MSSCENNETCCTLWWLLSDYKSFYLMATSVYSKYTTIMLFAFFFSPHLTKPTLPTMLFNHWQFGKPSYIQILFFVFFPIILSCIQVYTSTIAINALHTGLWTAVLHHVIILASFWNKKRCPLLAVRNNVHFYNGFVFLNHRLCSSFMYSLWFDPVNIS